MLSVEEHRLTPAQITYLRRAVAERIEADGAAAVSYAFDLEEVLDAAIHGGVQVVLIRYEHVE